ncbi:hypothetical protein BASA81_006522 [Batrachochytrium salamandrivorans]|nr:hypothetical protein BASA81_006522 [Batrachochytrium salamandrivorans]
MEQAQPHFSMDSVWLAALVMVATALVAVRRSRRITKEELAAQSKSCKSQSLSHSHDPLLVVRGQGSYLVNDLGDEYLDSRFFGVLRLGTNAYTHTQVETTLQCWAISTRFGWPRCLFVNSGSEATELALRLAHAKSGRTKVLAVENGYHGVTLAAMRASPYKWKTPGDRPSDLLVVEMDGDVGKAIETQPISCFIVESAQSVGGVRFPREMNWLSRSFQSVRDQGGVCICDEVQVGLGRTGEWFWAFERDPDCVPDIVTIGKGLGNGFPVAAVVCTQEVALALDLQGKEVFSTFGGNPVACQAALAVLEEIETQQLQQNALLVGTYLLAKLVNMQTTHSHLIIQIRGQGLFVGIEFITPDEANRVSRTMYDYHRVLTSCDGSVMVIKPPLCWTSQQVDEFCSALFTSLV